MTVLSRYVTALLEYFNLLQLIMETEERGWVGGHMPPISIPATVLQVFLCMY